MMPDGASCVKQGDNLLTLNYSCMKENILQKRPAQDPLILASTVVRSPRLTLLLFAAVDGKLYDGRPRVATNPSKHKPEHRTERKRKEDDTIKALALRGCSGDRLAKP